MQSYLQGTQCGVSVFCKPLYWFEFDKILVNTSLWQEGTLGFSQLQNVVHTH